MLPLIYTNATAAGVFSAACLVWLEPPPGLQRDLSDDVWTGPGDDELGQPGGAAGVCVCGLFLSREGGGSGAGARYRPAVSGVYAAHQAFHSAGDLEVVHTRQF